MGKQGNLTKAEMQVNEHPLESAFDEGYHFGCA